MVIGKLSKPLNRILRFGPSGSPFVWKAKVSFSGYTQPSDYDPADFDFTIPALNESQLELSQIFVDTTAYLELSTEALCNANEESWYFDIDGQYLYIHINHEKRMVSSDLSAARTAGYSTGQVFYDDNDIEYLPYMTSGVSIKAETDRSVYDKMSFVKNTLSFNNGDGEFDQFINDPVPGADINILYISTEEINAGGRVLHPVATGFSSGDTISKDEYSIDMQDKRAQLNQDIPFNTFEYVDYPDIEKKYVGDAIPAGYGDLTGIPAICVNGETTTGDVYYRYAIDGTSLGDVYVEIDSEWELVTPTATDPESGTFTLSAGDARKSSGKPYPSKCNARLRDYDSPSEILKNMMLVYANRDFITEFFDTVEWDAEGAYLADIYFYMDKQDALFDYIEQLQNASDYGFRMYANAEGKFSLKVDDINRVIKESIQAIDMVDDLTQSDRDFTEYATSVTVTYNEDIEDEVSDFVKNTDYQESTLDTYKLPNALTYSSNLKTLEDASAKAQRIALDYSVARNSVSFTLDEIRTDLYLYDIVSIDTSIYDNGVLVQEYMGLRTIKISEIEYNFEDEQTLITGFDITDVNKIITYIQGWAAGSWAAGSFAPSGVDYVEVT